MTKVTLKNDPIQGVIVTALRLGKRISFEYDGMPRLVEVHTVGLNKKFNPVFRGYQVAGDATSSDNPEGWKLFALAKIKQLPVIVDNDSLAPRDGYTKGDSAFWKIEQEL